MTNLESDNSDGPVTELSAEESWDLLGSEELGRLVVSVSDRVDIFPVNYVAHQGKLLFRTAEGTKLVELTIHQQVAFEVDHVAEGSGWSVVVHGTARRLQTSAEIAAADELPLHSWIPTPKFNYVEITPREISGRRLTFGVEPER
ncbi:pyridoxamine 5'-phosphate oxidase family protein [Rhodococcus sp. NPDC056960]|jgi:nitroimidazol reductase NimA-like FMN-containing flavoprotein (pyridoxamine 5'-phosphate oxidase superfamily)|uniref:pyridoxamine 5'-phosphate oxidase family protein n=1 Tax=Rhodococcus sp. NPDC056960 TaxID=3345982 RepID=UPI00363E545A